MIKFWFDKFRPGRASHRLRAKLPSQELQRLGHNSKIINSTDEISKNDIVIFSKDSDINNMLAIKKKGIVVGFDLCDNKFEEEPEKYKGFCKEVDFITVNTEVMQQVVKELTGRDSYIYIDSVEREIVPPNHEINFPLKLSWYGSSASNKYVNWPIVINFLKLCNIPYELKICVNSSEKLRAKFVSNLIKNNLKDQLVNVEHIEWTWEIQQQVVNYCHVVIIPIFSTDELAVRRTKTKSMNRLVDAIASGKFVIASPIPSYMPLEKFCWLSDFTEGIKFSISNKKEIEKMIVAGQEWIKKNASTTIAANQLIQIYNNCKINHG